MKVLQAHQDATLTARQQSEMLGDAQDMMEHTDKQNGKMMEEVRPARSASNAARQPALPPPPPALSLPACSLSPPAASLPPSSSQAFEETQAEAHESYTRAKAERTAQNMAEAKLGYLKWKSEWWER
eukprot:7390166-Prymnesium_polylepis.2